MSRDFKFNPLWRRLLPGGLGLFLAMTSIMCSEKGDDVTKPLPAPPDAPPRFASSDVATSADAGEPDDMSGPSDGPCVNGALKDFPPCCDVGAARCVPAELLDVAIHPLFGPCDEGGICVPIAVFEKSGTFSNAKCASILSLEGACSNKCSPQLAGFLDTLPQDSCTEDELCAPCVSPLDQMETGACLPFSCTGDFGHSRDPDSQRNNQPSCDNLPTEAVVDVSNFSECCEGAHCVPKALVSPELASDLSECASGLCVPYDYIAYAGFFVPETCEMAPGIEGRCVSTCLPKVKEKEALLPQATCDANERCSPCCDPILGETTGACAIGCDPWPVENGMCEVVYDPCCEGKGHCLPEALIPAERIDNMSEKGCTPGTRCVPDELTEADFVPLACTGNLVVPLTSAPFVNLVPYGGVCLPECLKLPIDGLIPKGSCAEGYQCAPCVIPAAAVQAFTDLLSELLGDLGLPLDYAGDISTDAPGCD